MIDVCYLGKPNVACIITSIICHRLAKLSGSLANKHLCLLSQNREKIPQRFFYWLAFLVSDWFIIFNNFKLPWTVSGVMVLHHNPYHCLHHVHYFFQ